MHKMKYRNCLVNYLMTKTYHIPFYDFLFLLAFHFKKLINQYHSTKSCGSRECWNIFEILYRLAKKLQNDIFTDH